MNRFGQPDSPESVTLSNIRETSLDLDAVSALCPNCHLLLVDGGGDLPAAQAMAVQLGATVISDSWVDQGGEALYEQFTFPGVATVASSGDDGFFSFPSAETWAYPAPSTLPNTTSAGGTDLQRASVSGVRSLRGYTETAWSGSGSSCDPDIERPPWQPALGCPGRATADASAEGGTAIFTYAAAAGGWTQAYGTSLSAPLIAAFYALTGAPAQNPSWIYQSAAALNDVTEGSNGSCSPAYLCNAGTGYDGPTGIGSISGSAVRGAPGIAGPGMLNGTYLRRANYSPEANAVSAELQGGVYSNGLATSYQWQYGFSVFEHETESAPLAASCSVSLASATLPELEPGQEYRYRLVAHNAMGTTYGFTYALDTTPEDLPAPEPSLPSPAPTACPTPSPLPDVPNPVRPPEQSHPRRSARLKVERARLSHRVLALTLVCRGNEPRGCQVRIAIRGNHRTRTFYRHLWGRRVLHIRLGKRLLGATHLLLTTYLLRHGRYLRVDRRKLELHL
ncbi:MAG: S8 family serine peptidase [Solirubrobacterales bacterium]